MKLSLFLPAIPNIKWELGKQIGVNHAIVKLHPDLTKMPPPYEIETVVEVKKRFEECGYMIAGLESDEFDMSRIKYGLDGRDEDLEKYCRMIRNCAEVGIPMICYNFMPTGWFRTSTDIQGRGGSLLSGFDLKDVDPNELTEFGQVSEERMWNNLEYFLKAVVPVADKYKVQMALHPDDPPLSPIKGVGRILTSADAFRRVLNVVPSDYNGITFCQATFKAMGEDMVELAKEWGKAGKIFFVHFRDISGQKEKFQETFHDDGPTDMGAMLKLYDELGFDGPIRPDHVPTMAGESNDDAGYSMNGRLYAIGYMRGLMEAQGITIE